MAITVSNNGDMDVLIKFKHSSGQIYSLEGVTKLLMHVRRQPADVAAVLHLSSDDGSLEIEGQPQAGEIRARKTWSEIHNLSGIFEFDVLAFYGDGRRPIYRDQISFIQGVTR